MSGQRGGSVSDNDLDVGTEQQRERERARGVAARQARRHRLRERKLQVANARTYESDEDGSETGWETESQGTQIEPSSPFGSMMSADFDLDAVDAENEQELTRCVQALDSLTEEDVKSVTYDESPGVQTRKVVEALAVVLGLQPVRSSKGRQFLVISRKGAQAIVRQPRILDRLREHTASQYKITADGIQALSSYITNPLLEANLVDRSSRVAGALWKWARATYAMQMRRPLSRIISVKQRLSRRRSLTHKIAQRLNRQGSLRHSVTDDDMSVTSSTYGADQGDDAPDDGGPTSARSHANLSSLSSASMPVAGTRQPTSARSTSSATSLRGSSSKARDVLSRAKDARKKSGKGSKNPKGGKLSKDKQELPEFKKSMEELHLKFEKEMAQSLSMLNSLSDSGDEKANSNVPSYMKSTSASKRRFAKDAAVSPTSSRRVSAPAAGAAVPSYMRATASYSRKAGVDEEKDTQEAEEKEAREKDRKRAQSAGTYSGSAMSGSSVPRFMQNTVAWNLRGSLPEIEELDEPPPKPQPKGLDPLVWGGTMPRFMQSTTAWVTQHSAPEPEPEPEKPRVRDVAPNANFLAQTDASAARYTKEEEPPPPKPTAKPGDRDMRVWGDETPNFLRDSISHEIRSGVREVKSSGWNLSVTTESINPKLKGFGPAPPLKKKKKKKKGDSDDGSTSSQGRKKALSRATIASIRRRQQEAEDGKIMSKKKRMWRSSDPGDESDHSQASSKASRSSTVRSYMSAASTVASSADNVRLLKPSRRKSDSGHERIAPKSSGSSRLAKMLGNGISRDPREVTAAKKSIAARYSADDSEDDERPPSVSDSAQRRPSAKRSGSGSGIPKPRIPKPVIASSSSRRRASRASS